MLRWILAVVYLVPLPAVADDWPQWLGPKRDGVWREDGILDKFPTGGPTVLWRTECGMGYAGPAVAAGEVYLADRVLGDGATNPDNPFTRSSVKGTDRLRWLGGETGKEGRELEFTCGRRVREPAGGLCRC